VLIRLLSVHHFHENAKRKQKKRRNYCARTKLLLLIRTRHGDASSCKEAAASFTYDDDGNLIDDGRYTYTWDGENRLICVERKGPWSADAKRLSFQYDYLSRRVSKMVETYSGSAWQQTQILYFIYDGWNVVEVVDAQTSQLLTQYSWGLDLSGSLQGAGGIGGLLASEWPQTVGESRKYWFFYDVSGIRAAPLVTAELTCTCNGPFSRLAPLLAPCTFTHPALTSRGLMLAAAADARRLRIWQ
jgi:YD repeat-containing protein